MSALDTTDIVLVVGTTAYALWLDTHKDQEPDWTWAEVVGGVAFVLAHAGLRSRLRPAVTWQEHENEVWRSFALGGLPIICGEISQALRGRRDRKHWNPWT